MVCIIGPLNLQNELITLSLEKQPGVKCLSAGSLDEARARFGKACDQVTLFLWDCAEKDLAGELKGLKRMEGSMPQNSSVGLFNVESKSWGNGMTLPRQVKGIVFEEGSAEDFMRGVSCLLDGKSWLPAHDPVRDPATRGACIADPDSLDEFLTPREQLHLSLIREGKSNQQIADALGVKYKTIKNYTNKLFRKLNVSSRDEAARWAKGQLKAE